MDASCVDRPLALVDSADPDEAAAFVVVLVEHGFEVLWSVDAEGDHPASHHVVAEPDHDLPATCERCRTAVVARSGSPAARLALVDRSRATGRPLVAAVVSEHRDAPVVDAGPVLEELTRSGGRLLVVSRHDVTLLRPLPPVDDDGPTSLVVERVDRPRHRRVRPGRRRGTARGDLDVQALARHGVALLLGASR